MTESTIEEDLKFANNEICRLSAELTASQNTNKKLRENLGKSRRQNGVLERRLEGYNEDLHDPEALPPAAEKSAS